MSIEVIIGLLMPFIGTTLGAVCVFFVRDFSPRLKKILSGFAAGIMLGAAVWSLLLPAMEMLDTSSSAAESATSGSAAASAAMQALSIAPVVIGLLLGVGLLLLLDVLIPHMHPATDKLKNEKRAKKLHVERSMMLMFAVTLHNLPEGMAVGVSLAGASQDSAAGTVGTGISIASALTLALGIALQNIPEGAIIAMPLAAKGTKRGKAFLCGVLSGVVEPIGALVTLLIASAVTPLLPYILSFAAGAMIYVVFDELIIEAHGGGCGEERSNAGIISITIGFILMIILDTALG